ncbi:hypothetical protein Tco_1082633 [Tanacetum coccineum]|uniref:Uncharacterized protein n=1 Tax=Tanacetum coccineum TaxID=301880 RepID=A0ABQ5I342_9ASTR
MRFKTTKSKPLRVVGFDRTRKKENHNPFEGSGIGRTKDENKERFRRDLFVGTCFVSISSGLLGEPVATVFGGNEGYTHKQSVIEDCNTLKSEATCAMRKMVAVYAMRLEQRGDDVAADDLREGDESVGREKELFI